ncbi:MAG TPA: nucleoside triphosphate pyrophosphatase [Jatrophihabitantaceae bacterium]|jgi:septum formation protein|nr:nucleoside triphosphate pyrophosphatase [Jatrophihabitantaceae bacterium]
MIRFVLASASPARLATLRAAGLDPEVIVSGVDESAVVAADTATLATRLAFAKASAVACTRPDALVLGCDSLLDVDASIVGKPASIEDAVAHWKAMRGRTAVLYTGHALVYGDRVLSEVAGTTVHFADPDDAEIAAYVGTGEPLAVAGSFTVDGLGGWFVDAVDGDHHNVVGVSLPVLRRMVRRLGLSLADLGWPGR